MSDNIREYKCPNCGSILVFNPNLQQMECPFCGTKFDMETIKQYERDVESTYDNEPNWTQFDNEGYSANETEHLHHYLCKSCGGEIITDETTAATSCPYCGNPIVMVDQFKGVLKPDYVVPFKYDKKAAEKAYVNHLKGKNMVPKIFLDKTHINDIRGIYVPFWMYDADAHVRARYTATRSHSWSDHDHQYTETKYYSVYRYGELGFDNVPSNGSSKMDSMLMESIEPFDMSQAVDFQTAYLAGYLADKYDKDFEECAVKANQRIRTSAGSAMDATVYGYDTVTQNGMNIRLENEQAKYCLLPVWLLVTKYNGQEYVFAMNGQTGKLVGDLPTDKGIYFRYFITIFLIVTALIFAATYLLHIL